MSNDSKVSPSPVTASAPQKVEKTHEQIEAEQKIEAARIGSSWGDRFKKAAFGGVVDVAINYFINTALSVALAYAYDNKPIFGKTLDGHNHTASHKIAKYLSKTEAQAEKLGTSIHMGTRGFALTMGGTALVPVIKYAKDHRHKFELELGHGLDVMQDKLGMGNAATAENLCEYKTIKTALTTGKTPDVSKEELERFKIQHCVTTNDKGKFEVIERKPSWMKALTGRAFAWGAAFGTNFSLDYAFGLGKVLDGAAPTVTKQIASRFPRFLNLKNVNDVSKNIMNDAILTVSSAVTQATADRVMDREKKPVPKKMNGHSPVAPASQPESADMQWAKQQTQQTIANAIKASESHTAQVADSRRDTAPSLS